MYQSYMLSNFGLTEAPEVGKVVGPIKMDESKYFIIKTLEKTVPTETAEPVNSNAGVIIGVIAILLVGGAAAGIVLRKKRRK